MSTTVVVGGDTFLGRALLRELVRGQPDTIVATHAGGPGFERFAEGLGVLTVRSGTGEANRALADADVAYHLAGSADHGLSEGEATRELADLERFLGRFRGRLVYQSSGAVYHPQEGRMEEDRGLRPGFPYARAKAAAERRVREAADAGKLEDVVVARVFYPFGAGEPERRLFTKVVRAARAGVATFTVRGDGASVLDPLDADDVARALALLADPACGGSTLNVCRGEPVSVRDFVSFVAKALGGSLTVSEDGVPEEHPVRFWGNPDELRRRTGFRPTPLHESIRRQAAALEGA